MSYYLREYHSDSEWAIWQVMEDTEEFILVDGVSNTGIAWVGRITFDHMMDMSYTDDCQMDILTEDEYFLEVL